ncbi:unnamed protein product [Ostreobium quekettii]|uniref:PPPDE domain-containing protein n=1 Tax=Ostreobium quekettii TaxID=121088 RepID=A0A8S1JAE0_9CHLO|nr:unnamed protein product [Ostreobium quekettii]|eukprot:evm.model.scf_1716EXC.2 EVM.evm.TU.scf_1716EXC.2   scf_1716EXC:7213-10099(-)
MAKGAKASVRLNVYDLSEQNYVLYWMGFGVFHTGVEVYGVEYAYGGHDYDASGIFATEPRKPPGPVEFRESIPMGDTGMEPDEVRRLVSSMGQRYRGNHYHLLQMNCNHFASDLCKELVGRRAPSWVNRLAGLAVVCHCLLPGTWVPPLNTPSKMPEEEEIRESSSFRNHRDSAQRLLSGSRMRSDAYSAGDSGSLCDGNLGIEIDSDKDLGPSGRNRGTPASLHFVDK